MFALLAHDVFSLSSTAACLYRTVSKWTKRIIISLRNSSLVHELVHSVHCHLKTTIRQLPIEGHLLTQDKLKEFHLFQFNFEEMGNFSFFCSLLDGVGMLERHTFHVVVVEKVLKRAQHENEF